MEELRKFCERALPITLDEEWEDFQNARQLLLDNDYLPDPDEPNTFIKVSNLPEPDQEPQIHFPTATPEAEYLRASADRNQLSSSDPHRWRICLRYHFDSGKVKDQVSIPAQIPFDPPLCKDQVVRLRLAIQPNVGGDGSNLLVHLQPKFLHVGVRRADCFPQDLSIGYFPSFTRLTLVPLFPDASTVAVPVYTPPESLTLDQSNSVQPARTTVETNLGLEVGWSPIKLTVGRKWGIESEVTPKQIERLVPVILDDDGNAASYEWSLLRWSDGKKFNARKPHEGFSFRNLPKPPFEAGSSSMLRVGNFPGALWYMNPRDVGPNLVSFAVHVEVEMHQVWFIKTVPFFRTPGSKAVAFKFSNKFDVSLC